jgi:hypothetical protein
MSKRVAQGVIEYLLMSALTVMILVWAVHHLLGASGRTTELGDALSNVENDFNKKAISEIISNIDSN